MIIYVNIEDSRNFENRIKISCRNLLWVEVQNIVGDSINS